MAVTTEDGVKYIECDNKACQLEIRTMPIYVNGKVYHDGCKP